MSAVADHIREGLFRDARPLSDGRMVVRWGYSFYIMEAEQLRRMQGWRVVYFAVQILAAVTVAAIVLLWSGNTTAQHSWGVFYFALITSLAFTFVNGWRLRRLSRQKPSDDEHDRLAEAWDRTSWSGRLQSPD